MKWHLFFIVFAPIHVCCQEWKETYFQAKVEDSLGNFEKAKELYRRVTKLNPKHANSYFNIGSIEADQKLFSDAYKDFSTYNSLKPKDPEALYQMAASKFFLGEHEKAIVHINSVLSIDSNYSDALKLNGIIFQEKKMYSNAVNSFERALLIISKDYEVHNCLGYCYEMLLKKEAALEHYLIAESLGLSNAELFSSIWDLSLKTGDFNKALIYINKAIMLNPDKAIFYYNQGLTFLELGFKDSAIQSWKKAKQLGFNSFPSEAKKLMDSN